MIFMGLCVKTDFAYHHLSSSLSSCSHPYNIFLTINKSDVLSLPKLLNQQFPKNVFYDVYQETVGSPFWDVVPNIYNKLHSLCWEITYPLKLNAFHPLSQRKRGNMRGWDDASHSKQKHCFAYLMLQTVDAKLWWYFMAFLTSIYLVTKLQK